MFLKMDLYVKRRYSSLTLLTLMSTFRVISITNCLLRSKLGSKLLKNRKIIFFISFRTLRMFWAKKNWSVENINYHNYTRVTNRVTDPYVVTDQPAFRFASRLWSQFCKCVCVDECLIFILQVVVKPFGHSKKYEKTFSQKWSNSCFFFSTQLISTRRKSVIFFFSLLFDQKRRCHIDEYRWQENFQLFVDT